MKPTTITTADGKVYELVPSGNYPVGTVSDASNLTETTKGLGVDAETGKVVKGTQEITYVYKEVVKVGEVVARYVIEGTEIEIATGTTVKPADTPVDETYGDKSPTIIEFNGKKYELVRTRTNEGDAPEDGTVVEGKQTITYEYKEVVEPEVPTTPEQPVTPEVPTSPEQPVTPEVPTTPEQPVTPAVPTTPAKSVLPNTGESDSALAAVTGLGMFIAGLALVGKRRKKD